MRLVSRRLPAGVEFQPHLHQVWVRAHHLRVELLPSELQCIHVHRVDRIPAQEALRVRQRRHARLTQGLDVLHYVVAHDLDLRNWWRHVWRRNRPDVLAQGPLHSDRVTAEFSYEGEFLVPRAERTHRKPGYGMTARRQSTTKRNVRTEMSGVMGTIGHRANIPERSIR